MTITVWISTSSSQFEIGRCVVSRQTTPHFRLIQEMYTIFLLLFFIYFFFLRFLVFFCFRICGFYVVVALTITHFVYEFCNVVFTAIIYRFYLNKFCETKQPRQYELFGRNEFEQINEIEIINNNKCRMTTTK